MLTEMLKPKVAKCVQRDLAGTSRRDYTLTQPQRMPPSPTLADIMHSEPQSYTSKSADKYLRKQHQEKAVKRLPYWMDGIDADMATAREHINRLYQTMRVLLFLFCTAVVLLLIILFRFASGL